MSSPVKDADGTQLFTDLKEVSERWKEHVLQLLNKEGNVDNDATDHLTARETMMHMNDPITMEELRTAVKVADIGKERAMRNTGADYSRLSQHRNRWTAGEVEYCLSIAEVMGSNLIGAT